MNTQPEYVTEFVHTFFCQAGCKLIFERRLSSPGVARVQCQCGNFVSTRSSTMVRTVRTPQRVNDADE